jgi:hypothetical protein
MNSIADFSNTAARPQHIPTKRERMIMTSLSVSFFSNLRRGASISLINTAFIGFNSNYTKIINL